MRNTLKKIVVMTVVAIFAMVFCASPVMAASGCPDGCVPTSILGENGCSCDSGNGEAIWDILKLVVRIMTTGIGILAILGVIIVGIQYLTAGANEEQVRKSKRRLSEIVIGVIAYVLIYALLDFLIPNFSIW